jgi:hypothetical protein
MHLQLAIQIAPPILVIVGFLSLINATNSYRRQMTVQILMKYTERYEHVLDQFPADALPARFDVETLLP